jgi:hypothetical protein
MHHSGSQGRGGKPTLTSLGTWSFITSHICSYSRISSHFSVLWPGFARFKVSLADSEAGLECVYSYKTFHSLDCSGKFAGRSLEVGRRWS